MTRILDRLPLNRLVERPRAVIGFSDNTALLLALERFDVVAFHGPHAGSPAFPPATQTCFRRVLFEAMPAGRLPWPDDGRTHETLRPGVAEGALIGGNLALLAASCGTAWQMRANRRIVFIEDVDEPLYRVDRMLTQLLAAGALAGAAGLALGRFSGEEGDTAAEARPRLLALIRDVAEQLEVPTVLGLPVGHTDENWTLPLGVRARLDAGAGTLELLEPAVT